MPDFDFDITEELDAIAEGKTATEPKAKAPAPRRAARPSAAPAPEPEVMVNPVVDESRLGFSVDAPEEISFKTEPDEVKTEPLPGETPVDFRERVKQSWLDSLSDEEYAKVAPDLESQFNKKLLVTFIRESDRSDRELTMDDVLLKLYDDTQTLQMEQASEKSFAEFQEKSRQRAKDRELAEREPRYGILNSPGAQRRSEIMVDAMDPRNDPVHMAGRDFGRRVSYWFTNTLPKGVERVLYGDYPPGATPTSEQPVEGE